MATTFIWVKEQERGINMIVNTQRIECVIQQTSGTEITLSNGVKFKVQKTFSEIMELLEVEKRTDAVKV